MMIRVDQLHARYSKGEGADALRELDLEVKPGRIYALLGPNGAGKTTLLRCLTGLLPPASGSMRILGVEIRETFPRELLRRMGVLLESPGAYGRMTAEDYLNFFAGFHLPGNPSVRIRELAQAFELESLDIRIAKLSQGNRRKVQLMRSLLHHPALVLWDEPTEHLDPGAQRRVLSHLRTYVSRGASALVTSHRLEQMEEWADEYGFLRQGGIVHTLSRASLGANVEEAEIEGAGAVAAVQNLVTARFASAEAIPPEQLHQGSWGFRLRGREVAATLPDFVEAAVRAGARVLRAEPKRSSLESLYRRFVEETP